MPHMITAKDSREFHRLANAMCALIGRIRTYNPEAEIFIEAEGGFMLFDGPARLPDTDEMNWEHQDGASHWAAGIGCGAI